LKSPYFPRGNSAMSGTGRTILLEGAGNGRESLDVRQPVRPDSIILDLMMPVMDGTTYLELMRGNRDWQHIGVIVFTGYGDDRDARRLAELGVEQAFLKASISYSRLIAAVA
jgi:CheY-like chemotaxis protein